MAEVKLFGSWASPFSRRVEMALKFKGVEYEYVEEDLNNKSLLLLKYNPIHKKVPVLLHKGKPIAESLIILEYIDETWQHGPTILPKDPYQRANARFWANFVNDKCMPQIWKACWTEGEERERAMEKANKALEFLENEIKGKKFFGGDSVGYVDFSGNALAYWSKILAEVAGLEFMAEDKYPNLWKWADEFCNCNFVKENLPHKDTMVQIFKGLTKAYTSSFFR